MNKKIILQIILQLILILINAFFASAEIAVVSLNENKVKAKAEDGDKKAKKMIKLLKNPTKFLSTIQVGITLAGFLGSAFAADSFSEPLTKWVLETFNLNIGLAGTVDSIAVIVITLILSYFTLVLGELVPKRIAMKNAEKLADKVSGFILFLTGLLKPVVWFLTVSTNGILRLFGIDPNEQEETVSEEDIVIMLDAGAEDGTLNKDNIEYIKNVFELDHLTAGDVMTPRNAIELISDDAEYSEIIDLIVSSGYSRIPVYSETVDNITGILYARDFVLNYQKPDFKLKDAIFEPTFVPETVHLDSLFKEMQMDHNHIVIVVDEYGGTAGLVTMEDILEEIVGEIWDEQDEEIENFQKIGADEYKVLTTLEIDEFFEFFGLDENEEIESTTVNGWVTEVCGMIPEENYSFDYQNLTITVLVADEIKTQEILVKVKTQNEEAEQD
ncbi:MAG: HlyC/CorC family transporter [Clostridiales bacterium]|nr:HlyC/CorC family transporter [Clostridiales bacterium]